jgi:hypothetical protein
VFPSRPQERIDHKPVKNMDQRPRGIKEFDLFCNCQEFNLFTALDMMEKED